MELTLRLFSISNASAYDSSFAELTEEADYLVGSKEGGGLSIEQTKRLSIAVELA